MMVVLDRRGGSETLLICVCHAWSFTEHRMYWFFFPLVQSVEIVISCCSPSFFLEQEV